MSIKKLYVKAATVKIPSGYIPYFGKFVPGALKTSMLPIPILIIDADDQQEYECELVEVVSIKDYLPSIFTRMAEDKLPEELEPELLSRLKVQSINQIAFYLYRHGRNFR
jgi:hypothetical protein